MLPIAIKGGKDGLRIVLSEQVPWEDVLQALPTQLGRNPEFFHGVELTIDTGARPLQKDELQQLMAAMAAHGLQPTVLATDSREGRTAGRTAGIQTRGPVRPRVPATPVADLDSAFMVQKTLRSGQLLRHPGHITVIGDVNAGAEVIAGGSIVIWGRLRGSAHAGALGDESACVCAIELTPTMLRIGSKIAQSPASRPSGPEVALVTAQGIEVKRWLSGKH